MEETNDGSAFKDINVTNEKIYKSLQKKVIKNMYHYTVNEKIIICKGCNKLNIEAKICNKCELSLCFSCQKSHKCNNNENMIMIIDEKTREKINNLKFRCNCQKEITLEDAKSTHRKCLEKCLYLLKKLKHTNGKKKINIGPEVEKKNENNIQTIPTTENIISNNQDKKEESNPKSNRGENEAETIYSKKQSNKEEKKASTCITIICPCCYECKLCNDCCNSCDCKNNKFCNWNCKSEDEEEKNCLEYLFKEKGECTFLSLATFKSLVGIIFSVFIIAISPLILKEDSLSESEIEEINQIINIHKIISGFNIGLNFIAFILGYIFFFNCDHKKTGAIITNIIDFFLGDIGTHTFIFFLRKKIVNYFTNDDSKQEIIKIIQDIYGKLDVLQIFIFIMKICLFLLLVINFFILLCNKKKEK